MSKRAPGVERLMRARRAAAKELRLPVTDWRVRRYALLACAHDDLTARLAAGTEINIDGLLKLDGAMQEIRASVPQEPLKVKVQIVEGPIQHCPKCGWRRDQPLTPLPSIDGEIRPSDTKPIIRPLPPPAAAKPEPPPAERRHPGSIHDQPGARMRVHGEPWRGHVGTVDDP